MYRRGLVVALLLVATFGPTGATAADGGTIASVYPNPATDGDSGEYVVLSVPPETDVSGWTLSDGETTVHLPNVTVSGRIAVSGEPAAARNLTDLRVVAVDRLRLANGGERLVLRDGGEVIDRLAYDRAPEAQRYADGDWRPIGATNFSTRSFAPGRVRTYVFPDAPGAPLDALRSADRRLLLAGYTLTSERVADALVAAARRGVAVKVLVDAEPVGGMVRREARLLDRLVAAGVAVRVLGGPRARYDYHHAKYAVADDRAVVLTENWKPAGVGGHSSRGWGVTVYGEGVADHLARIFAADFGAHDAVHWTEYRREHGDFRRAGVADGSYVGRYRPETVAVRAVEVVVAPDDARRRLVELLRSADRSIRVQQMAIGSLETPLVRAMIAAARRGVEVRVLLSSAWYVREGNRKVVARLRALARREDLPLRARMADPLGRYGKIHAKGVIVDGETVVVGSVNWNNNSLNDNRELAVIVHGKAAAAYYRRVFRSDWRGGAWRLRVGVVVGGVLAVAAAVAAGRRVEFARARSPRSAP